MIQHFIKRENRNGIMLLIATTVFCLSSCTDSSTGGDTGGTTCTKCIDNKPAPTGFSSTLNAINHSIPLTQAITMIDHYNTLHDSVISMPYKGSDILPMYETFNLKAIDSLICQKNAIGFRIYMAMDDKQKVRFVLVGVDGDGKDIIQRTKEMPGRAVADFGTEVSALVEEAGQRWP